MRHKRHPCSSSHHEFWIERRYISSEVPGYLGVRTFLAPLTLPKMLGRVYRLIASLPFDLFRYVELLIGIVCGCMPMLPQLFRQLIHKVTQKLSHCCSNARDFLGRFSIFSRITGPSTALPRDSKGDLGNAKETKKGESFVPLGLFGNNGRGLPTMIRAALPSALTSITLFHKTKQTNDDSVDLESLERFAKITVRETSTSNRSDIEENNIPNA